MRPIDADKLPVHKIYHVDEAGYGATFYIVDIEDVKAAPRIAYADIVPHGKWENFYYDESEDEFVRDCSICGKSHTRLSPYCPNCGARMNG